MGGVELLVFFSLSLFQITVNFICLFPAFYRRGGGPPGGSTEKEWSILYQRVGYREKVEYPEAGKGVECKERGGTFNLCLAFLLL